MQERTDTGAMMTAGQVAERLGVSSRTVARWCSSGSLPAIAAGRGWRVDPADLAEFLEQGTHARLTRYQPIEFAVPREPR